MKNKSLRILEFILTDSFQLKAVSKADIEQFYKVGQMNYYIIYRYYGIP